LTIFRSLILVSGERADEISDEQFPLNSLGLSPTDKSLADLQMIGDVNIFLNGAIPSTRLTSPQVHLRLTVTSTTNFHLIHLEGERNQSSSEFYCFALNFPYSLIRTILSPKRISTGISSTYVRLRDRTTSGFRRPRSRHYKYLSIQFIQIKFNSNPSRTELQQFSLEISSCLPQSDIRC